MPDKWTRITDDPDSLPELKRDVLLWIWESYRIGRRREPRGFFSGGVVVYPTHWQPLPEPPRE